MQRKDQQKYFEMMQDDKVAYYNQIQIYKLNLLEYDLYKKEKAKKNLKQVEKKSGFQLFVQDLRARH